MALATAAVNGTTLAYEVVGEGPPCLVLHGWPGADHTYLRPGLDALSGFLRLVYYDHRGSGHSGGAAPDPFTVEDLADDAVALADHLGEDRVLVLGHHHGTMVAQELALRHPERVAGLVLVAASPGELGKQEDLADTLDAPPPPPEVEVLQRVPPATDEEWAATMQALSAFFFHRLDLAEQVAPFARTTFRADATVQAMLVLNWWSAVDRLGELTAPILLLAGRHDVFSPPQQGERIAKRAPGARLVVFEESGHLPWVEEPDAFVATVRAWLETNGIGGTP